MVLVTWHAENLRHIGLVGHANRQAAGRHRPGDAFRGHVDRADVLVAQAIAFQGVGQQEIGWRQRIEADLLAFEIGHRGDRLVGDDGVAAVGEIDRHHHFVAEALGHATDDLVVGEHAAVEGAAQHGRRDQRRIIEELQLDLEAMGLVQVEFVGHVKRRVTGPDHGADLHLLNGLGGEWQHTGNGGQTGAEQGLAQRTQGQQGHGIAPTRWKSARDDITSPGLFSRRVALILRAGKLSDQHLHDVDRNPSSPLVQLQCAKRHERASQQACRRG